jgi:hypothetical protein
MAQINDAPSKLKAVLRSAFPDAKVSVRADSKARPLGADWRASIDTEPARFNLLIEYKPALTGARLVDAISQASDRQGIDSDTLWMLASDYLSPAMQQKLRRAAVPFVDLAGNAWIVRGGVHIDRRGFPNPDAQTRLPKGPFSDKASLVIRALFASSQSRGVRDLAGELDLTPSYVSKVLRELERRGYLARRVDGVSVRRPTELLDDWLHFCRGRQPYARKTYFAPATSVTLLMEAARKADFALWPDYALTMQSGASLVSRYAEFDTLEVYVRDSSQADGIASQLGARSADRGANLVVMAPYYRVSAFFGQRTLKGLAVVSDLQLYLDLYDFPQRGREQAEHIYERRLLPRLRELEE